MSSFDCEGTIAKNQQLPTEVPLECKAAVKIDINKKKAEKTQETTYGSHQETPGLEYADKIIETKTHASSTKDAPCEDDTNENQKSKTSFLRVHFQQKSKVLRDVWTHNHKRMVKMNHHHTQILIIILISLIAICCSGTAMTTNSWTCDKNSHMYFGLWNTCYKQIETLPFNATSNATTTFRTNTSYAPESNSSKTTTTDGTVCAHQGLYKVYILLAEKTRIDQISASQGLIVCGTFLYFVSLITTALAYKFINIKNLNSVRNTLVTSMSLQIVSFFLQLIGFYLFILTERLSISVTLLFLYFGFAIFATNIINFITIEYKSYKMRHQLPI